MQFYIFCKFSVKKKALVKCKLSSDEREWRRQLINVTREKRSIR